jgi:hypothetical protein
MSERATQIKLDKLQIVARPRLHLAALDLGVLIARRWYRLLLVSWLCVALPVFTLLWLVLPEHPIWSLWIVWWLKPAYERIPLSILSTVIFGASPDLKAALRGAPRAIWPGMLAALTYRRLSPSRAFEAPVWVLERLSGELRRKRLAVLHSRAGSGAFWLTVLGVHVEAILALGVIAGGYLFIPAQMDLDWWAMLASGYDGQKGWLVSLLFLSAMAVVGPIYVASGFALYLNRRIELEAWDLEIGFRRLAQRAAAASSLVLVGAVMVLLAGSAHAEQSTAEQRWFGTDPPMELLSEDRRQSREVVYDVLAGEDFNQQRTQRYPKFLHDWFARQAGEEQAPETTMSGLADWIEAVALAAEVLLWAALAVLLIWIVMRARSLRIFAGASRAGSKPPPLRIRGLDLREESLPDDISGHASELWHGGARRDALSLIYRGSLLALVQRFAIELRESDTEGDCLLKARAMLSDEDSRYFSAVTRAWQMAAYAHAFPSEGAFAALCEQFPGAFELRQGPANDA